MSGGPVDVSGVPVAPVAPVASIAFTEFATDGGPPALTIPGDAVLSGAGITDIKWRMVAAGCWARGWVIVMAFD
jgi:hypothetical protein